MTKLLIHTITQREKTAHDTLLKLLFFKEYTFQHTEELCSLCRVNGRGGGGEGNETVMEKKIR